jgi:hypothetical protein
MFEGRFHFGSHPEQKDKGITFQFLYEIDTSHHGLVFEKYCRDTFSKRLFAPCNAS